MPSVFISSLVRGYEDYREAARRAVGRFGWGPIMSEDQPAQDLSPRAALLREVGRADVYLLILGPTYGGASPPSPTEEEYREAARLGKPVVVMVQEGVEREPAQEEFIARVSAGWEGGRYRASFASPDALSYEISLALRALEIQMRGDAGEIVAATERLAGLIVAAGAGRTSHPDARIVVVPVGGERLIMSSQLNHEGIAGELADAIRAVGLADSLTGFRPSLSASGVEIEEINDRFSGEQLRVRLEVDGSVTIDGPIGGGGQMGGMWIDPQRLSDFVRRGLAASPRIWTLVGAAQAIRTAAIQLVIPQAGQRSFGRPSGNTISMGGSMRLSEVFAPAEPEVVSAASLVGAAPADEILARVERVYRDARAVNV